jgi:hypothetical protein
LANDQSLWEKAARHIVKSQRELAPKMAQAMIPGPGTTKYSPQDERKAFWQRNPDVDEQAIWTGMLGEMMQDGTVTYEEAIKIAAPHVAMLVYPARLPLIRSGDRKLSVREQIAFTNRMEKLGPPGEGESDG